MKNVFALCLTVWLAFSIHAQSVNVIELSQDLVTGFKMNQGVADFERELAQIPFDTLVSQLGTDVKRKTFWLNIYIAYSQKQMGDNTECDKKCKKLKGITVANRVFSLNDILYKILLHSKGKITPKRIFVPEWEKALRVSYPDGRIILATTGDKEIADMFTYFEVASLNDQLAETAQAYLKKNVYFNVDKNTVFLPKWLKHFRRDFGKEAGMKRGLIMAGVLPEESTAQLVFTDKMATLE